MHKLSINYTYFTLHMVKYMCMTYNKNSTLPIKIHIFIVDGIGTYVVEPIGGNYGEWYNIFRSKCFDSLEEAMREVVELNHQPTFL
jgi:hypothetical protein